MTVTYTAQVATCRAFGCFLRLLLRWKGSIYKLVYMDLVIFLSAYYILSVVYRYILDESSKRIFESIVSYCNKYSDLIPISFVLGFYVSIVMTRWWNQYTTIPFPDPLAVFVSTGIHGQDERGRVMRRTIMRYVCLCVTMMFTMISPKVKKRFPSLDHFVESGLLSDSEKLIMDDLNSKFPKHSKHWLPLVWAASIVTRARKEGRIRDDFAVKTVIDELNKIRGQCGLLLSYDTISVPLVYTQVVTLAVYSYFLSTLMGHQWVHQENEDQKRYKIDLYFPVFTTLQFFFYMGWLKVAESLINPFGEDDDDFEVMWMVDRNLQVSYLIVDEMHHEHPELVKDQYWDEVFPSELPYTVASERYREEHPEPSTANIAVHPTMAEITAPSSVKIGDIQDPPPYSYDDHDMNSGIHFTAKGRHSRNNSATSMSTVVGTVTRVNSVTNMLKKLFNRQESQTDSARDGSSGGIHQIPSSASIYGRQHGGSVRITDQVIEEVDEQQTVTSQHSKPDPRPSVRDVFVAPPASLPVDIPLAKLDPLSVSGPSRSRPRAPRTLSQDSAGSEGHHRSGGDSVSIGSSSTDSADDEFAKLKEARDNQRRGRMLAYSGSVRDTELHELENLIKERRSPATLPASPKT